MTAEIEFDLPLETTLARLKEILESLDVDGRNSIGGDDGTIQYSYTGEVTVLEVEDDDMPETLSVIIGKAGCWPTYINRYESPYDVPYGQKLLEPKLKELDGDFDRLWAWMLKVSMEVDDP